MLQFNMNTKEHETFDLKTKYKLIEIYKLEVFQHKDKEIIFVTGYNKDESKCVLEIITKHGDLLHHEISERIERPDILQIKEFLYFLIIKNEENKPTESIEVKKFDMISNNFSVDKILKYQYEVKRIKNTAEKTKKCLIWTSFIPTNSSNPWMGLNNLSRILS